MIILKQVMTYMHLFLKEIRVFLEITLHIHVAVVCQLEFFLMP